MTGKKRSSVLPDVPTAVEAGVKGFQASSWNALAVPGKTPRPIIDRLNKDIVAALAKPDVRKKLADLNIDADQSTPDEAAQLLASDHPALGGRDPAGRYSQAVNTPAALRATPSRGQRGAARRSWFRRVLEGARCSAQTLERETFPWTACASA